MTSADIIRCFWGLVGLVGILLLSESCTQTQRQADIPVAAAACEGIMILFSEPGLTPICTTLEAVALAVNALTGDAGAPLPTTGMAVQSLKLPSGVPEAAARQWLLGHGARAL